MCWAAVKELEFSCHSKETLFFTKFLNNNQVYGDYLGTTMAYAGFYVIGA